MAKRSSTPGTIDSSSSQRCATTTRGSPAGRRAAGGAAEVLSWRVAVRTPRRTLPRCRLRRRHVHSLARRTRRASRWHRLFAADAGEGASPFSGGSVVCARRTLSPSASGTPRSTARLLRRAPGGFRVDARGPRTGSRAEAGRSAVDRCPESWRLGGTGLARAAVGCEDGPCTYATSRRGPLLASLLPPDSRTSPGTGYPSCHRDFQRLQPLVESRVARLALSRVPPVGASAQSCLRATARPGPPDNRSVARVSALRRLETAEERRYVGSVLA